MKLKIGNVIRDKRRAADMTQEELAARLGVSFQAVSRWENGAAYPDLELLPVLAGMFGVTVDELLGEMGEERAAEYMDKIIAVSHNSQDNWEEVLPICRSAFAEFPNEFVFAIWICTACLDLCTRGKDEYRDEMRNVTHDILERCTDVKIRDDAVSMFAQCEDDDKLAGFLDRYTVTGYNNDRVSLLRQRYKRRGGDPNAQCAAEYEDRINAIRHVLDISIDPTPPSPEKDPSVGLSLLYAKLDFLNVAVGVDEATRRQHSILGDGVPDLWFDERVLCGLRISCSLAALGKTEEALTALEEVADVVERFISINIDDVLSYRTDPDGLFDVTVTEKIMNLGGVSIYTNPSEENAAKRSAYLLPPQYNRIFHPWQFIRYLTVRDGWEWFDNIRKHPRYLDCVERIKRAACID